MLLILLLLLIIPQYHYAQTDEILLPELDLILEDQSQINTINDTTEAVLLQRTPEFQEVYLDELTTDLADTSLNRPLTQVDRTRLMRLGVAYGSFNNVLTTAYAQQTFKNLFYRIYYEGQFRQNISVNNQSIANTKLYRNNVQAYFDIDLNNTLIGVDLGYKQRNQRFITNTFNNQDTHYIPIGINTKYWIDDQSYIDVKGDVGVTLLRQQNTEYVTLQQNTLVDTGISFAYKANLNSQNYFEVEGTYLFNDYSIDKAHTGIIRLKNDYKINSLWTFRAGVGLVSSSENAIFGWPEIAFILNYLDWIFWDIKASGDFNLYSAQKASDEIQFFSLNSSPESRWIYSTSFTIVPSSIVSFDFRFAYSDYNAKRIYDYNPQTQLYSFQTISQADVIENSIALNLKAENIFDMRIAYYYKYIPREWLLYSPHQFEIIMNIGYKPVGFNINTSYTLFGERLLTPTQTVPISHLLNIRVSQKVYKVAELFIEVNNILNQPIQFVSGTFYGGLQVNGGATFNF